MTQAKARNKSHRAAEPTVELESAQGTWRGKLPRGRRQPAASEEQKIRDAVGEGLRQSWKKFRRRARRGVPGPRSRKFDDAVHDLRAAARRFHSIARALPPQASGKAIRRAMKSASRILDWTGDLRDLAVERGGLTAVVRRDSKIARGLDRSLKDAHDRLAKKLAGRLPTLKLRKKVKGLRRLARDLQSDPHGASLASEMVSGTFDEAVEARRAADPTDPQSLHRLRIAMKRFRYVLELFEEAYPPVAEERTASVQSLQRAMGDLRDNERLAAGIARAGKQNPGRLRDTAGALEKLERRHSAMMTSFLKSVDAILDYWGVLVESFRRGLPQP
jgi:CHAD domain-containing protein